MIPEGLLRDAQVHQGTIMSLYGVGAGVGGTVPVWGTHEPELWLQVHGWTDVRTGKLQTQSGDSPAWAHLTTGETEIQSHSIHCSLGMPAMAVSE